MSDIWQQFHQLPRPIRDAVASPQSLAAVDQLEQQYPDLDVAGLIMRVMVKQVGPNDLTETIASEGKLDQAAAEEVAQTLRQKVFQQVGDFLGLAKTAESAEKEPARVPTTPASPKQPLGQPKEAPAGSSPPQPAAPPPARPVVPPPPAQPENATGPVAPTQAYSEDDEKEIEQQMKHVQHLKSQGAAMNFDDIAQQIVNQHQLAFPDELLSKRAIAIFKTRLKEIRDSTATLDMLTRDPKIGGLGMDKDLAEQIVTVLEERSKELKNRGMVETPRKPIEPPPPPVPKIETAKPIPQPPLRTTLPPENLPIEKSEESLKKPTLPTAPIKRPPDIPPPPEKSVPPPSPHHSRVMDRPKVADISRPSKTVGPAEEMQGMSVAEFRRLGQGATDSTKRLFEKFNHLQSESFRIWSDALAGWRQSEVYRLYLAMGRESLEENISISDLIKRRAKNNEPYLSEHEFTALADLNRQLQP